MIDNLTDLPRAAYEAVISYTHRHEINYYYLLRPQTNKHIQLRSGLITLLARQYNLRSALPVLFKLSKGDIDRILGDAGTPVKTFHWGAA